MKRLIFIVLLLSVQPLFGQTINNTDYIAFPQIAVGGDSAGQNYTTLIQIVNNNSSYTSAHLTLYSDGGSPLSVLIDGQGPQSSFDFQMEAGEARQIQLTLNGAVTAGWMEISYNPSE